MLATFLTLPVEIRIKIYTIVFTNTTITLHALKDPQPGPPADDWAGPASRSRSRLYTHTPRLLSTQIEAELSRSLLSRTKLALLTLCHQVRSESLPHFLPNVLINIHVGGIMYVTSPSATRTTIKALFNSLITSLPQHIISKITRLAFFIESTTLFPPSLLSTQFPSLRFIHVWDWKSLCLTQSEYFSEVGCGSTRHEEYNMRMAEYLYDQLELGKGGIGMEKGWKTCFQHSVYDTMDDVLELGKGRGEFKHRVMPREEAVISREDMDVENLTAYPLR